MTFEPQLFDRRYKSSLLIHLNPFNPNYISSQNGMIRVLIWNIQYRPEGMKGLIKQVFVVDNKVNHNTHVLGVQYSVS